MTKNATQKHKVYEFLSKNNILFQLPNDTKENTIRRLLSTLPITDENIDTEKILEAILKRESLESTGIGNGIAIPHAQIESLNKFYLALGLSEKGIDFCAVDEKPVKIVFLVLSGNKDKILYIRILARLARLLHNNQFRTNLLNNEAPESIINHIKYYESF